MITETKRLYLREITQADYAVIAKASGWMTPCLFGNNDAFSDEEVAQWFDDLMTQTRGQLGSCL